MKVGFLAALATGCSFNIASGVPDGGIDTNAVDTDDIPDVDGDGVLATQDCDDLDPTRWVWGPNGGNAEFGDADSVISYCASFVGSPDGCGQGRLDTLSITGSGFETLQGLECIHEAGTVTIADTDLVGVYGLENLRVIGPADAPGGPGSVAVGLSLSNNAQLLNLDGLMGLEEVAVIHLYNNDALPNIDGLWSVRRLTGLWVDGNAVLQNLDGLGNSSGITPGSGGSLLVNENDALQHIDGLSGWTTAGTSIVIAGNDALEHINGLSQVNTGVSTITIDQNAALTDINGLANLPDETDYLSIRNNASLENIDALQNQTHWISGAIVNNDALTNLDGLTNLRVIERDLDIEGCDSLTSVGGLLGLEEVGLQVTLADNANVAPSDMSALLEAFNEAGIACDCN